MITNYCGIPILTKSLLRLAGRSGHKKIYSRINSRRLFFRPVIQPDFEFAASAIVTSVPFSQKQRLLSLWRRAVRCAAGIGWQEDVTSVLKDLRLTPLTNRWALKIAIDVRRCYFKTAPPELCKKLSRMDHNYSISGKSSSFCPFRPVSQSGSMSFSNRATPRVVCSASINQSCSFSFYFQVSFTFDLFHQITVTLHSS